MPVGTIKRRIHDARKRLKQDMMDMVEHVLRDNAPNDELADKVFALLNPSEGVFNDRKTLETFENIGGAGKDGFTRAMALPHWRSRRLTVQYLAMEYGDSGPTKEFAIARLKEALRLSAVVSAGICCQAEPFLR